MDIRTYMLKAFKEGCYRRKDWVLDVFTVTFNSDPDNWVANPYPYRIVHRDGLVYFLDPDRNGDFTPIEGYQPNQPLVALNERVELKAGDTENLHTDITTTYGNLFFNYYALIYAFGNKIEYINRRVNNGDLERLYQDRIVDDPGDGEAVPADMFTAAEVRKHLEAMFSITGFTQLCVPSASRKTMTVSPDVIKRKNELLAQYEGQLHDPTVIALIDKELTTMDREWFKGDSSEGFYIKGKSFDVVRKRAHIMHGGEYSFSGDGSVTLIPNSLDQGWDTKFLPEMINSLRDGSFSRGALTALGGESVKFLYRVFQNSKISEDDCGSKVGLMLKVTRYNAKESIGSYYLENGKLQHITEDNIDGLVGQTLEFRSPLYCHTLHGGFCARCMGDFNARNPNGLNSAAAAVGSVFMGLMMKAMHGKALKLADYSVTDSIS